MVTGFKGPRGITMMHFYVKSRICLQLSKIVKSKLQTDTHTQSQPASVRRATEMIRNRKKRVNVKKHPRHQSWSHVAEGRWSTEAQQAADRAWPGVLTEPLLWHTLDPEQHEKQLLCICTPNQINIEPCQLSFTSYTGALSLSVQGRPMFVCSSVSCTRSSVINQFGFFFGGGGGLKISTSIFWSARSAEHMSPVLLFTAEQ